MSETKEGKGLSFAPSDMGSGGGLWSDVDATITQAAFVMSNFGGSIAQPIPTFELKVVDEAGEEHDQLLSVGRGKVIPSQDGNKLIPLSGEVKLNVGSNFGLFITSMVNGGFPEDKLRAGDISVIVGTKAHFERVAAPKRTGIVKAPRADGKVFEDTILTVTRVLVLPWDAKGKGKVAGKAPVKTPAAKGKAVEPTGDGVEEEAGAFIIQALAENPEGLTVQQLAVTLFKLAAGSPNKAAIVKTIYNAEFMAGLEGVAVENGVVSLA